jgi:hypothetical protein
MWKIVLSYGIPDKIVRAIKTACDFSKIRIAVNGHLSENIEIDTGILQGDTLSPFLFIIVLDYVMKKLPKKYRVLTHENPDIKLSDIEYANDGEYLAKTNIQQLNTHKHPLRGGLKPYE